MSVSKETFENEKKYTKTMLNYIRHRRISGNSGYTLWFCLYASRISDFRVFGVSGCFGFLGFGSWTCAGKKEHVMLDLRGSSRANGCFAAYMFHCEKCGKKCLLNHMAMLEVGSPEIHWLIIIFHGYFGTMVYPHASDTSASGQLDTRVSSSRSFAEIWIFIILHPTTYPWYSSVQ